MSLSADQWEEGDWKWVRKLVVPLRGQNQRSGTFMNILHVKSIKLTQILCVREVSAIYAVLSLLYHHCYSCQKTKSRLHTPDLTVVNAQVVCTPKILIGTST